MTRTLSPAAPALLASCGASRTSQTLINPEQLAQGLALVRAGRKADAMGRLDPIIADLETALEDSIRRRPTYATRPTRTELGAAAALMAGYQLRHALT